MIIRAIDPGPGQSAFVDWDGDTICDFGIFDNNCHFPNIVGFETAGIEKVVIEMVACYGMPVGAEVFETAYWVGKFSEQYESAGIDVERIYRKDIKLHICGQPRARDANIITAIVDRFDPLRAYGKYGKGTKKNIGMFYGFSKDVWQAFAVALTAFDNIKEEAQCQI